MNVFDVLDDVLVSVDIIGPGDGVLDPGVDVPGPGDEVPGPGVEVVGPGVVHLGVGGQLVGGRGIDKSKQGRWILLESEGVFLLML